MIVALGIQHAMCMRHIVICGLSRSTTFFHLINSTIFEKKKKVIEFKMRVFIFSTSMSEIFLIIGKSKRDMIKDVYWSSCKLHIILVRFG